MQDVGFRPRAPCLAPWTPRLVTLPEELALISSAASQKREKIQEHIAVALGGAEVGLGTSQPSSSAGFHSFVSIPDDVLREMERAELIKYAASCRDHYEQSRTIQMHTMGEVCTYRFWSNMFFWCIYTFSLKKLTPIYLFNLCSLQHS